MRHTLPLRHGATSVVAALALMLAAVAHAQDGAAPPPADPPADETPAVEPPDSESAPVAPKDTSATPGRGTGTTFAWGDSAGLALPPLVEIASAADLDAQTEFWRGIRADSENRMLKARERSLRWKSQTELQKSEVELLSKQVDAAKKEKREVEKKDLEAAKKGEEKKRDFADAMRQVMEARADFHKAQVDLCEARLVQIDQERRLLELWSTGGYEARVGVDSRALEQRILTMSKDHGDRLSALAGRERTLADRSQAALRLWTEMPK